MSHFNSDNNAPIHPNVLAALAKHNHATPAYGNDPLSQRVSDQLRLVFDAPDAAVYLLGTGTAANALALASITQPWQAIFCHTMAHINQDECGAPEFFTAGAKLIPIAGDDGRIDPATFQEVLSDLGGQDVHRVQPGALSLTNVTELGTLYTPNQIADLCAIASQAKIKTHLDGARFANAIAALNCSPADLTWRAGVDIISFGGTKNGLLAAEAVIIFDPELAWEFELRRKRAGQLYSKYHYLSLQMQAYLDDGLWLKLAAHANAMAADLAARIDGCESIKLLHPVQANMLFARCSNALHARLNKAGIQYYATPSGDDTQTIRLVCSWSTTTEDVDHFAAQLS